MSRTAPVTVVIPAFQAAPFLEVTLEALHAQTRRPEKIVVVDDGSTDDTAAIAERLGAEVIRQDQKGPGAARNRGLEVAETEFVAFCDADDWYAPDKLERGCDLLGELKANCCATDAWVVRGERVEGRKNEHRTVPSVMTLELLLRGNPIVCSTVIARRELIERVGGFDESPEVVATEDYDLWLRLAAIEPIAYMPRPQTFYRVHEASLSANTRFLQGVDFILEKVRKGYEGEAHFLNLIKRRRADVRLDLAWDLLAEQRFDEARELIEAAQKLSPSWKGLKLRLRSMLRR